MVIYMRRDDDISIRKKAVLDYDSSIGGAIAYLRKCQKLDQHDVAEHLECSQSLISKIEAGQRSIKVAELAIFADAMGLPIDAVIDIVREALLNPDAYNPPQRRRRSKR